MGTLGSVSICYSMYIEGKKAQRMNEITKREKEAKKTYTYTYTPKQKTKCKSRHLMRCILVSDSYVTSDEFNGIKNAHTHISQRKFKAQRSGVCETESARPCQNNTMLFNATVFFWGETHIEWSDVVRFMVMTFDSASGQIIQFIHPCEKFLTTQSSAHFWNHSA